MRSQDSQGSLGDAPGLTCWGGGGGVPTRDPLGVEARGDREGWRACGKVLFGGLFRGQRHSPRLGRLVEVVSVRGPMKSKPGPGWLAEGRCCDRASGWKQLHGETQ